MQAVRREVNRVLVITLVLNLAVALAKIITGILLGALAITADGFHSLADSLSNVVGLIANKIAGTPPDDDHPYGHQRFETLAALSIGVLLLLTALETVRGIIERVNGGEVPQLTPPAFIVMLATLVINIGVNRYQVAAGKRLKSEILLADAANTGADIFVTLSVLVSMVLMLVFEWYWVDIVAAVLVVVLIVRAALDILNRTTRVLVDAAPYSPEMLAAIAAQVPAVVRVSRARSRGAMDAVHIDIDVQVAAETTAERSAIVAQAVEERLRDHLEGVTEVSVQFAPTDALPRDPRATVEMLAESLGLTAHHIYFNPSPRGEVLEFHVEVPPSQTLDEAHTHATQLEKLLRARMPQLAAVVTHIEPAAPDESGVVIPCDAVKIQAEVMALLQSDYPAVDWHNLQVYDQARGAGLTIHAKLPADVSIEAAHDLAAAAERLLRAEISGLDRITIHTEPF